jgi:two-component system copper resistance phosphate regulon response regulator CusR
LIYFGRFGLCRPFGYECKGGRAGIAGQVLKILIIGDEEKMSAFLKKGLEESGDLVDVANDGAAGLTRALDENYDVILLDVMLPKMDGWTVLKNLRVSKATPVIFVTASDDVIDRVREPELDGQDCLVKPFVFVELLARVHTLGRRDAPRESDLIKVADLEIDVIRRQITRGGMHIDLTPREFDLLKLIASRPGEVLSRTQIASYVWDMNFDSDANVVEIAIRRLGVKVDDDFALKLIRTVAGVGYVLDSRESG